MGERWRSPRGQPGPLRVVALDGGPTRTLAEVCTSRSAAGRLTARCTSQESRAEESAAYGRREVRPRSSPSQPRERGNHGAFRLRPARWKDGGVPGMARDRLGQDAEIWAIDLETGDRRLLTPGNSPRYASTGHLLFGTPDGTLMAAPIDEATAELTGPAVRRCWKGSQAPRDFRPPSLLQRVADRDAGV